MEFVKTCFAAPAAALQQCLAPAEPPIAAPVTAETSSAPIASAYVVSAPTAAAPIASKAEPLAAPSFNANELKALADPPLFAEYGELHKRALAYMRSRRDAAVAAEPNIAPSAEMASDVRLMRFLIAKSFDCAGSARTAARAPACVRLGGCVCVCVFVHLWYRALLVFREFEAVVTAAHE